MLKEDPKDLIFIFRSLSDTEEQEISSRLFAGASIYIEESIITNFSNKNYKNVFLIKVDAKVSENLFTQVAELGKYEHNGKSIEEILTYRDYQFWHYLKFKIYHQSVSAITQQKTIIDLVESGEGKNITIYSNEKILSLFKGVTLIPSQNSIHSKYNTHKIFGIVKYGFTFLLRAIIGFLQYAFINLSKRKILFIKNHFPGKSIIDLKSLKTIKGDHILEYLYAKSYEDKDFLFLSTLTPPSLGTIQSFSVWKHIINKRYFKKIVHFEWFLLSEFLSIRNYKSLKKWKKEATNELERILGDSNTEDDISMLISVILSNISIINIAFYRLKASRGLFKKLKSCKVVTGMDENTLNNRPFMDIAKQNKITTIGLLHGTLNVMNLLYAFSKRDVVSNPWTDYTISWGTYSESLLINRFNYPKEKIKILGQLRTDCIPVILQKAQKKEIEKKIVVTFASQAMPSSNLLLREKSAEWFFQLTKDFDEVLFVLKPHPKEEENMQFLLQIAESIKAKNFQIMTTDLYEILSFSDIVLTSYSTVGIEAVYFDKELITLDYNNEDKANYYRDGVAHKATSYSELRQYVEKIIAGQLRIDKKKKDEFIRERAFKIDGNTTDRYYDFIKSFSNSD